MTNIADALGKESDLLLNHICHTIPKNNLELPGADFIDRVMSLSNRKSGVLRNLQALYDHGRLTGTGYYPCFLSIKVLNIRRAPPLRQTPCFLIPKILWNSRSKAAAMALHRH